MSLSQSIASEGHACLRNQSNAIATTGHQCVGIIVVVVDFDKLSVAISLESPLTISVLSDFGLACTLGNENSITTTIVTEAGVTCIVIIVNPLTVEVPC